MYCPNCSTAAVDGAKFCKVCGINLNVINQAINGGVTVSDPARNREYKRTRRQISEGINGAAIGAALLIAALLVYLIVKESYIVYPISLLLALTGLIKLLRNIGSIVDAKVGNKLLDVNLQTHQTGGLPPLNASGSLNPQYNSKNTGEHQKPVFPTPRAPVTGILGSAQFDSAPLSAPLSRESRPERPPTGRINREQSSPLKKMEIDDDLISKLRN